MKECVIDPVADRPNLPMRICVAKHLRTMLRHHNHSEKISCCGIVVCDDFAVTRPREMSGLIEHNMTKVLTQPCQLIQLKFCKHQDIVRDLRQLNGYLSLVWCYQTNYNESLYAGARWSHRFPPRSRCRHDGTESLLPQMGYHNPGKA